MSVTEKECTWNVPKSVKKVNMESIKEIDFETPISKCRKARRQEAALSQVQKKPKYYHVPRPTSDENTALLRELAEHSRQMVNPLAVITISDEFAAKCVQRPQYPPSLRRLFKEKYLLEDVEFLRNVGEGVCISINVQQSCNVQADTKSQSKSALWFTMRAGRITASNFKKVCRTNLQKPSLSLLNSICYPEKMKFMNEAMKWGSQHEETARKVYQELKLAEGHVNFTITSCGLFINPDFPFLGASPDGLVKCDCCGPGCVEIKCPFSVRQLEDTESLQEKLQYLESSVGDASARLKVTHDYFYQVQCQLFVCEREYCDFFVWSPKKFLLQKISKETDFWEPNVFVASEYFHKIVLPELLGKVWTRAPEKVVPKKLSTSPTHRKQVRAPMATLDVNNAQVQLNQQDPSQANPSPENRATQHMTTPNRQLVGTHSLAKVENNQQVTTRVVTNVRNDVAPLLHHPIRQLRASPLVTKPINDQQLISRVPPTDENQTAQLLHTPNRQPVGIHGLTKVHNNQQVTTPAVTTPAVTNVRKHVAPLLRHPIRQLGVSPLVTKPINDPLLVLGVPPTVKNQTAHLLRNSIRQPAAYPGLTKSENEKPIMLCQEENVAPTTHDDEGRRVLFYDSKCDYCVFAPLSKPDMNHIDRIFCLDKGTHVLTDFGLVMTADDMQTLLPTVWLTDQIINFYFKLLKARPKTCTSLPSVYALQSHFYPFLRRRIETDGPTGWTGKYTKIFGYNIVLAPIFERSHWSLVVIDMSSAIFYLDSIHKDNNICLDSMETFLNLVQKHGKLSPERKWTKHIPSVPQQNNRNDCGIYTCLFGEHAARRIVLCLFSPKTKSFAYDHTLP